MFNKRLIKTAVTFLVVIICLFFASRIIDYYNRRGNNQTRYYHENYSLEKALDGALKSIK